MRRSWEGDPVSQPQTSTVCPREPPQARSLLCPQVACFLPLYLTSSRPQVAANRVMGETEGSVVHHHTLCQLSHLLSEISAKGCSDFSLPLPLKIYRVCALCLTRALGSRHTPETQAGRLEETVHGSQGQHLLPSSLSSHSAGPCRAHSRYAVLYSAAVLPPSRVACLVALPSWVSIRAHTQLPQNHWQILPHPFSNLKCGIIRVCHHTWLKNIKVRCGGACL